MEKENAFKENLESSKLLVKLSVITGIGSFVIGLIILISGVIKPWGGTDTFALSLFPYAMTMLFSVSAFIYGLMSAGAAQEAEEKVLLEKRKQGKAFDANEDVRFTAGRSFENYKKYAPYFLAALSAVITLVVLLLFWRNWNIRAAAPTPANPLHGAFVSVIFMTISIFAGAFCVGQSRDKSFRWLRPVGAWLITGFVVSLLSVAAALGHKFGYPRLDYYLSRIVFVLYALLGAEFIINFTIEFYRPRTLEEPRPIFESRLMAMFTEPGGVMRNFADTLDYQFGFKVSGTWIYSFIEKSLFPLVILWLVILWAFTGITEVGPNQLGIKECFGKVINQKPLEPGIYYTLPWPFGKISHYSCSEINTIYIGPEFHEKNGKTIKSDIVLWTNEHYNKESRYLVATEKHEHDAGSDGNAAAEHDSTATAVSFIGISMPVNYRIKADKLMDYALKFQDPARILKNIGEQETIKYLASISMENFMGSGRHKATMDLKKLIQQAADKLDIGVEIIAVNLHDAHPPIKDVGPAYQKVFGAKEQKEAAILAAQAYRTQIVPATEAQKQSIIAEADTYKNDRIMIAEAESERFGKQLQAFKIMPELYMLRTYLKFLETNSKDIRKYIMSSDMPYDVYELNLEQKTRLDLIDVDLNTLSNK